MPCFYELTMSTILYSTNTTTIGVILFRFQDYDSQQMASAMAGAILIFIVLVNWLLNKLTKGKFSI
jgi:iron(III) transport system permease protein